MELHGKIWNAQMPIIISDEGNYIRIYNGKVWIWVLIRKLDYETLLHMI